MFEVIFLIVLALIWLIFASIQDLRKREVANWLNFSLIIFALGFRFFYSFFSAGNFAFFYQGLIGLGIFFILGNLFYYGRMFAGGDAKLMIALGTVLPFSTDFAINTTIFLFFFVIFLFTGACYGLITSAFFGLRNFKKFSKEFKKRLYKKKNLIYLFMIFGLIFMVAGFIESMLFVLGAAFFILPYFYLYAKSVDESCMIKRISTSKLEEGDWLYENVKVGRKLIKKSWSGLSAKNILLLKKNYRSVLIRQGIPFVPVFLISFLILIHFWFTGKLELFLF